MNYYKILEVDKDASPEVIEKAYKTLVKKYHPDLQESNMREKSEGRIKLINEAYEVLSNPVSRSKYDLTLKQSEISQEDYNKLSEENISLHKEINNLKQKSNFQYTQNDFQFTANNHSQQPNYNEEYRKQLEYENEILQAKEKAYHDAYIQDLKNRGYKIRYKKTPKDYFKNLIAFILTLLILFLLLQIAFINNFFKSLFSENPIIRAFLNIF